MSELGVIDLWRDFYPTGYDYTHYFHPHAVYSRIDYFFIFKRDHHRIQSGEIGSIDLSDHAPLQLTLQISNIPGNTLWKLYSSILNNLQFRIQIKEEIKQILQENDNGEVGPEIIWDTLKAVVREKIISYCVNWKRERKSGLLGLNRELKELETKQNKKKNQTIIIMLPKN